MNHEGQSFTSDPDPDNPGWLRWKLTDESRYNEAVLGKTLVRAESETTARIRIQPARHLTNSTNRIHGGATLGLIDIALFAAAKVLLGIEPSGSVTIGIETQFIGAGDGSKPVDAVVEILRETGRMIFLRGVVEQDGNLIAAFSATTRKPSRTQAPNQP